MKEERAALIARRKAELTAAASIPAIQKNIHKELDVRQQKRTAAIRANAEKIGAYTERQAQQYTLEEQELARRVLARRSLLAFILRFEPTYLPGWVHKHVCKKLEKFYEDCKNLKNPRLMLFLPPRSGKSTMASHYFPAWALGNDPSLEIISASYSSQLAESFSRKARGLLREPSYHSVFPKTVLDEDTQSVAHWQTQARGAYVAVGVGGGATGKGAHMFIIDDPIKNSSDAGSYTVREAQKEWYESTAYTRLAPGGGILIIQTRWHLDDLSGWLEDKADKNEGDHFDIVRFPAIATENEKYRKKGGALHPERYSVKAFDRIKKAVGPKVWAALYQQNPAPDDGVYFRKQDFHFYDTLPANETLRFYASWDLAIGEQEVNDYTVGVIWAVDPDENVYLVSYIRGHYNAEIIIDKIISTALQYNCSVVTIEKGQILMALGPALNKSIQDRKAYAFVVHPMAPGKRDKSLRARSIQARMMQGRVKYPKSFEGSDPHIEMLHFPAAKHDDFVDAMAYIGLYLEEAAPGSVAQVVAKKSWRDNIAALTKGVAAGLSPMSS